MKNLKKMKSTVILLTILSLVFLNIGNLPAVVEGESGEEPQGEISGYQEDIQISKEQPETAKYAPDELIVHLKEGKTLRDIQELNTKYNVTSVEKVFEETPSPEETLKQLKEKLTKLSTSTEHERWYWQLDKGSKEYQDYQAKIEKEKEELKAQIQEQEELLAHLEQRQKRAPEGVTPPNLANIYLLKTSQETDIPAMASDYQANPAVEYAEPNHIVEAFEALSVTPNDPSYPWQSELRQTEVDQAWVIEKGRSEVIIAIVDSGVFYFHPDLQPKLIPGKDFVNSRVFPFPQDDYGHGTMVAGIAAAMTNNKIGIAGVAWNCKTMPIKVLDKKGNGKATTIVRGIRYATDKGADVINLSLAVYRSGISDYILWGRALGFLLLHQAVKYAYAKGCVLVAAAGNESTTRECYPAAYNEVISVGAINKNDRRASFSNFGSWIDIYAPGVNITSTAIGFCTHRDGNNPPEVVGCYAIDSGTSFSSPHVSGIVALVISKYPNYTNQQIKYLIMNTATKISYSECTVYQKGGSCKKMENSSLRKVNARQALQGLKVLPSQIILRQEDDERVEDLRAIE